MSAWSTDDASRSSGSVDLVFRPNRNSLKTVNPTGASPWQYRAPASLLECIDLGRMGPSMERRELRRLVTPTALLTRGVRRVSLAEWESLNGKRSSVFGVTVAFGLPGTTARDANLAVASMLSTRAKLDGTERTRRLGTSRAVVTTMRGRVELPPHTTEAPALLRTVTSVHAVGTQRCSLTTKMGTGKTPKRVTWNHSVNDATRWSTTAPRTCPPRYASSYVSAHLARVATGHQEQGSSGVSRVGRKGIVSAQRKLGVHVELWDERETTG